MILDEFKSGKPDLNSSKINRDRTGYHVFYDFRRLTKQYLN